MKRLLALAVAAGSFVAVAAYTPTTVGVRAITTSAKNTIVAVPYKAIGSSEDIAVDNLVKAANLPNGTMLVVYNGSYYAWVKNDTTGSWQGVATATTESAGVIAAAGSGTVTLAPGLALWVVLPAKPATSQTIYVYGNGTTSVTTSSISAGSQLVANPLESSAKISVAAVEGDEIRIPNDNGDMVTYVYKRSRSGSSAWRKEGVAEEIPSISAGQGLWYIRAAGSAATTITWTAG